MINKIRIKKFKSIGDVELVLDKINVLVGGNNSGKSSILQAIQFATSVAQTTSSQNVRWVDERLPSSISSNELIYTPIQDVYALGHNGKLKENQDDAIEISFQAGANEAKVIVRKGRNKNISIAIEGKVIGEELQKVAEPFSIIVPGLAGIPAYEYYKTPSTIKKAAARGDSNSVFRNILLLLSKQQGDWDSFIETLHEIYPNINIRISFDEVIDENINVTVGSADNELPIDACGTGVLQAIQILSYIYLFKPKILILDEPDSHLHPNNQKKLVEVLKNAQLKSDTQIIISTHSKYIVEELIDDASVFWINNGALVEKVQDDADRYIVKSLMEIGALSEGERLNGQDSKVTIVTEDHDGKYIKLLIEANGWEVAETEIWPYQGCSNLPVANALIKYIRKKSPEQIILLHRDRDFLTDEEIEVYKSKIKDDKTVVFVPSGNDLEYYFTAKDHFLELYDSLTEKEYSDIINNAIIEKQDELKVKLINTRIDTLRKNGEKPNEGEVAVTCTSQFDADKLRYSHGKILLKAVNEKLRIKTGVNSRLTSITSKLTIKEFADVKELVWPVQ